MRHDAASGRLGGRATPRRRPEGGHLVVLENRTCQGGLGLIEAVRHHGGMRKPTSADLVVAVLSRGGPELDDDELASATGIDRHYVNALCNRLAADGVIVRQKRPSGKLVNRLVGHPRTQVSAETIASPRGSRPRGRGPNVRGDRIADLIANFSGYVAAFEATEAFRGPSLYFHNRAIERRRGHTSAQDALSDEAFLEYVYAVLPAWGMHRMGKQAAKVGDFAQIVSALQSQEGALEELWPQRITELTEEQADHVAALAWQIIATIRVSTSGTQIVAGSKWLHHLLPDLIPPIDRQYTFSFFTGQKSVYHGDHQAFLDWLPLFRDIGVACKQDIRTAMASGGFMATGEAKIIDNAIMGYMQGQ